MTRRRLTILGATGSIGTSTLEVVDQHPDRFEIFALTGHLQLDRLAKQCLRYSPKYAVVDSLQSAQKLAELIGQDHPTETLAGLDALEMVASSPEVDTVMAAIVGAAGLKPTLAAVKAGKRVLLANKEALVMAGHLFMTEVRNSGAKLLPIDSEHNAIFQSLPSLFKSNLEESGVRRILLTGSGGPFRTVALEQLAGVTPDQACAHPNWVMGRKISVDSATMMNKGLEVIEAHWLFGATPDQIEIVVHPQSVIHSMVEYADGSVLAQLGHPDMRTPIAHALGYPDRIESGVGSLDLCRIAQLTFEKPDLARFPCIALAYRALRAGGNAPAILNAANEVAVAAFLDGRLPFLRIADVISAVLDEVPHANVNVLEDVLHADNCGRDAAQHRLASWAVA